MAYETLVVSVRKKVWIGGIFVGEYGEKLDSLARMLRSSM